MATGTTRRKLFSLPRIAPRRAQVALEDYMRLRAEFDALRVQFAALQKEVDKHSNELRLQLIRMGQMQAILDEERKDDLAKLLKHRPSP